MAAKKGQAHVLMSLGHRTKIGNSKILNHLIEHAEGEREMSATQVTAAIALLRKVLPDLQSVQHGGDPDNPINVYTKVERAIVRPKDRNG